MRTWIALAIAAMFTLQLCLNYVIAAPIYDEQVGISFATNFDRLAYNVTAVAQSRNGTGPAYLLNGLTDTGYWYQAGIAYNWPTTGTDHYSGFSFAYQVWSPSKGLVYPSTGGGGISRFSGQVNPGDKVLLSIELKNGTAMMSAMDWSTGAYANTSFTSEGASYFVGNGSSASNRNGYFTGLMTEWYYDQPYSGDISRVTYDPYGTPPPSAWLWLDEFGCMDGYNCTSKSNIASDYTGYAVTPNPYFSTNYHGMNLGFYSNGTFFTGGMLHSLVLSSFKAGSVQTDSEVPSTSSFSVGVLGGIGPYTYTVYVDNSVYAQSTSQSPAYSGNVSTQNLGIGNHTYRIGVLDSSGSTVLSPIVNVAVNSDPSLRVYSRSNASDVSIGLHISFNVTGGTQPYNITWYVNNASIGDLGNKSIKFALGRNLVYGRLVDAVGMVSISPTIQVTMNRDPIVGISPESRYADVESSVNISASTQYGTPPYSFSWSVDGKTVSSNRSFTFSPGSVGTYQIALSGSDAAGYSFNQISTFTVNPALRLGNRSFSNSSSLFYTGSAVSFSGAVTGGTPPYSYTWYVDGIPQFSANATSLRYDAIGIHTAKLVISDAAGGSVTVLYPFVTEYNYTTIAALGAAFVLALVGYAVAIHRKLHRNASL